MEFSFETVLRPDLIPDFVKSLDQIWHIRYCTCDAIQGSGDDACPCKIKMTISDDLRPVEIFALGKLIGYTERIYHVWSAAPKMPV